MKSRLLRILRYQSPLWLLLLLVAVAIGFGVIKANRKRHHDKQPKASTETASAVPEEMVCPGYADWRDFKRPPLYITPHFEKLDLTDPKKYKALVTILDKLEPGGPHGKVQLGYMLGSANPLQLYVPNGKGGWRIDPKGVRANLDKAAKIGRPFVLNIVSDHFQPTDSTLLQQLLKDPRDLMHYRDGSVPDEAYFGYMITPLNLTTDRNIPVAMYKWLALETIAHVLAEFDKKHPGLLVGITLNGETHFLYSDFYTGTGNFTSPKLTDYGDQSIAGFQKFLDAHGIKEDATRIRSVDFSHYNAGILPVSGWITPESVPGLTADQIAVYVDGKKIGHAMYPVNRLDVYESANLPLHEPNTGFSYDVDASGYAVGSHVLQIVVERNGDRTELASRLFHLGYSEAPTPDGIETKVAPKNWRFWIDWPLDNSVIDYDPLARAWITYRGQAIGDYIEAMAAPFKQAGFEGRVFSYQLAPWMFGNWNDQLFGIGHDFFKLPGIVPGINLYGGNQLNPLIFSFMDTSHGYAVPETHPQMFGAAARIKQSLEFHYCHGARFVSPYYFKLATDKPLESIDKFRISPDNKGWGSDSFYQAISDFVKE